MPEITVIMRVHRGGSFLEKAVASVRAQTHGDWELLLVLAGREEAAAAAFASGRDPRVRTVAAAGGCGPALVAGTEAATGRFIAILDEDDLALPRRLELQRAFLAQHPEVELLATATEVISADDRSLGLEPCVALHEEIFAMSAFVHVLRQSSLMFRRELLGRVTYRRSLDAAEDFDFIARAAEVARLACLPAVLCRYRRHADNITVQAARRNAALGALVRLLTRRRRTGQNEDYAAWHRVFLEIAEHGNHSEAEAHRACARVLRREGHDDLATLHAWLAWRTGGGWVGGMQYFVGALAGLRRNAGRGGFLARAWLKEPAHQLLRARGMPDRAQF